MTAGTPAPHSAVATAAVQTRGRRPLSRTWPLASRGLVNGLLIRDLVATARPGQWQKNLLLYAALIFSAGEAWSPATPEVWAPMLLAVTAGFWLFNAAASGAYFVNDALDAVRDRAHPRKRARPVAAGRIPRGVAFALGAALMAGATAGALALRLEFGLALLAYVALTLAYSLLLKHLVVVDLLAVAGGFALRAVAGAAAIEVPASPWLYVCTALGALFVVATKRRQELALLDGAGAEARSAHRAVLGAYTPRTLEACAATAIAAAVVGYALYAATAPNLPPDHSMLLTVPLVAFGFARFRHIAARNPARSADEIVARDAPLAAAIVLFVVTALVVLGRGGV